MRNLKKFLALVLAMMMAFSLMVTANAANEADNGSNKYGDKDTISAEFLEAVDVLNGMGIMTGDYGNFKGSEGIMRSEMAAVLYRLMTGDTTQLKNVLYAEVAAARFEDVKESDWFAPYIGWCYDAGIMVGSNGYFRPHAKVTGYETLVMVLRAMGYGKNHEYTGIGWSVNASSDGTQVGLLKDVNNSHYANTLAQNTRRDVVASIVFQAAQLPTVTWSPSLGYNKYIGVAVGTGGNQLNPSLGMINFGLTSHYGIVVGNEVTGEAKGTTKIGFSVDPVTRTEIAGNQGAWQTDTFLTDANITDVIDKEAYIYATDDTATADNVTLTFYWDTDLYLFNHAVKVWYDCRGDGRSYEVVGLADGTKGTKSFPTNNKTYALYDKVVATAVVASGETSPTNVTLTHLRGKAVNEEVDSNWNETGFVAPANAYFNYAFAAMTSTNYGANVAAGSAVSPILMNDEATARGLYLLISNTPGNVIDVVISLDMTFTQVVQANTTTRPTSVGVLNANGAHGTNEYFGDPDDDGRLTGSLVVGSTTDYVSLVTSNLRNTKDDAKALRAKVAAIEITGTAGTAATAVPGNVNGTAIGKAPAAFNTPGVYTNGSTFYYQLTKNTQHETDTVIKVDTANNDVYLKSGKVLHQSVFAEATDGTFVDGAVTNTLSGIEGYTGTGAVQFRLIAGKDYTFTLDEQGHYIYWETPANTATFVYETYLDFTTVTASSIFDYPMVYVDTNGEMQKVNITKEGAADMGYTQYAVTEMNKRDFSGNGSNSGYVKGKYIGYILNGSTVTAVTTAANDTGYVQAASTSGFATGTVTINGASKVIGAEEVGAGSNLFLTENTQFYIVDGAGTDSQKVQPFKGISALMEGMSSVDIDGQTALPATLKWLAANDKPYEMFYYQAGPFDYDQTYDPRASEIKTIFLPRECVTFNPATSTSLVFIGDSDATMINSNNSNFATQYTVWRNGEPSSVWIDGDYTDSANAPDAYKVAQAGDNVFYELRATDKKATDGETIYKIEAVANAADTVMGYYWNGTTVAVAQTGSLAATYTADTDVLFYQATTFNQQAGYITDGTNSKLFTVGSAGIKNLDVVRYPGILDNNLSTLNGAGSLRDNIGVPVSCILNTADSTHQTVSFIYVNA